jgi:hypothetical protein
VSRVRSNRPVMLHHSSDGVTENLRMIRPCADLAETEGTCPGEGVRCRTIRPTILIPRLFRDNGQRRSPAWLCAERPLDSGFAAQV